jgi:hypothetical protein
MLKHQVETVHPTGSWQRIPAYSSSATPSLCCSRKRMQPAQNLSPQRNTNTCIHAYSSRAADACLLFCHAGTPLPHPVSDQRPLKSTLPSALLKAEGASYYWFWRNLLNFVVWSGCAATNTPQTVTLGIPKTGNASREWFVPRGWTVHSTIWQPEGSQASGLYWPFATIIYKGDSVAIFIRCGTLCHSVVPGSAVLCCGSAQCSGQQCSAVPECTVCMHCPLPAGGPPNRLGAAYGTSIPPRPRLLGDTLHVTFVTPVLLLLAVHAPQGH